MDQAGAFDDADDSPSSDRMAHKARSKLRFVGKLLLNDFSGLNARLVLTLAQQRGAAWKNDSASFS